MDGHIKVDTAVLLTKADEVSALVSKVSDCFSEIENSVNNTNSYWIGEAGNAHREKYLSKKGNIDEAIKRLNENVNDLRIISGEYAEGERQVVQEAENLVTSVIN